MYEANGNKFIIAVVIPCYRVSDTIAQVARQLPDWVDHVIAVDDKCPDHSTKQITPHRRVRILQHEVNQGVGGAMISGYREALRLGADLVVKMDGDDQMDPVQLPALVHPVAAGYCDLAKGNRFFHLRELGSMPLIRRVGNLGLTFLTKLASGHWHMSDPTNGFFCIHRAALERLDLESFSRRYFFETSLLIQLNIARATVLDIAMPARYGDESSSLSIRRALFGFPPRLIAGFMHRVVWRYFVHDINATTICMAVGVILLCFGVGFGAWRWLVGMETGIFQSAGTVALSVLPTIVGTQFMLQALLLDVMDRPDVPLCRYRRPVFRIIDSVNSNDKKPNLD
jgi:glycosyltransferase involved in cell wall biosynthesis